MRKGRLLKPLATFAGIMVAYLLIVGLALLIVGLALLIAIAIVTGDSHPTPHDHVRQVDPHDQ